MNNLRNILWGIVLIFVGVIIGLNSFGVTNIDIFFDGWWTLFIIIPCFIGLFNETEKTGNIIGMIIGIFLLLCCQDILDFDILFKLALPIILIVIGLSFIFKDKMSKIKIPDKDNDLDYCATFSNQNLSFEKNEFKGCDLTSVFGGIKCDLTKGKIKDKSVINASAIFGGVNIIVPDDVDVLIKSMSIFGGVSNKHSNAKDNKKTIYINATCLFGGVEINDSNTKDN